MNIVIVEDEPKTARLLKELVEAYAAGIKVVAMCESIETTIQFLKEDGPKIDLFFMDVQLADGLSFEIFKQVKIEVPVIFCTAFDHYALEAFKANGIDYILKPFGEQDIALALEKLYLWRGNTTLQHLSEDLLPSPPVAKTYNTSFLVKFREKMFPVLVADIALISLEQDILYLYTFQQEKHPIFKTIDEAEQALNPQQFFRINRQMIIHRNAIREMEPYFNRKLILHLTINSKEKPVVSRLKVSPFLTWMEKP